MYDLIVVGAGPAGSFAARTAAKAGLYVLLMEKESFPRYKPCGGGLSNRAFSILDFPLPEELCERTINSARVHFHNNVIEGKRKDPLFTLVTRSEFDNFLLQKAREAGCNTVEMRVDGYKEKEDHVEVITKRKKFKSRFLVIAGGCQSRLRHGIQGRPTRDLYGNSVVAEIKEDDEKIQEMMSNSLDFYFDAASTGYGWIFPHRGYYSVGIWGQASRLNDLRANMQNFLARAGFSGKCKLHGHRIPIGGADKKVSSGRVILAGDCAGFVDPLTGEGIYYALRSGQIAARTILEQDPADVSSAYDDACRKDFGEELRTALRLLHLLEGRREIYLSGLIKDEEAINRYLDIMAGQQNYKGFADWLTPRMIEIFVDSFNDKKSHEIPGIVKGFLGNEKINFKIINNDRSVIRAGLKFEDARIISTVEGGLMNPTITIAATEGAINRIQRSKHPLEAVEKERQNGSLDIKGKTVAAGIKLNALFTGAAALRLFNNAFFGEGAYVKPK